jgi:hypothetical protein
MRLTSLALIGGAALAAAALVGLRHNSAATAAPARIDRPMVEKFVLHSTGEVLSCVVEKAEGQGPLTHVRVAPGCDTVVAGLSKVHYWNEKADGTVELSANGSAPAVIFAPGDGVAYESVEPRTPLMSLMVSE